MRVFSKKNLELKNPAGSEKVRLRTMEFANLPEWAVKDPLFLWAKAEGSLEVMGEDKPVKSKTQVKREALPKEQRETMPKEQPEQPEGQQLPQAPEVTES